MATVNEKMTAIADNIRSKTGSTEPLTLDGMASGVNDVYDKGHSQGESDLWDLIQNNGSRRIYDGFFMNYSGEYIRPKYKVDPKSVLNTNNGFVKFATASNVKIIESEYIDFSNLYLSSETNAGYRQTFTACKNLEHIEDIGMQPSYYYFTFSNCSKLHTIDVVRFDEESLNTSMFAGCVSLRNITIEGTIACNISFATSKSLTIESLKSIITHLKDFAGTDSEFAHTLTLSSNSKALLEAEGNTSPNGNSWLEYIGDLKWNY